MHRIALLPTAFAVALITCASMGCHRAPDPCARLLARMCAGQDRDYCRRAGSFLDAELTGPDGRRLVGRQRAEGCRLILRDARVVGAYRRQAARVIRGVARGSSSRVE